MFPIPKWALFLIIGDLNRHPLNHVYSAYSVKAPECILLNTLLHWLTQSPDELAQREKREITGKIQQLKLACVEAVPSIRIDPLELVLLPSSPASRQNLVKSVE